MSDVRPTDPAPDVEQSESPPRQSLTQRTYYSVLDQRIAAAQAEGAFDNLPGAGKPLQFEDDALVPEEDRVGYRILKNAGFAPPWIELQKTIHVERSKLDSWLTHANNRWPRLRASERQRLRDEHRERITTLNRLILHYNLVVPQAVGQMPALVIEEELARLG